MDKYYATRYQFDRGRTSVWRAICDYLQRYIPLDSTVLDIGSGYADFINNIAAQRKYAVDCNGDAGKFCVDGVNFVCADINEVDLNIKADVIFMSNLLEHLSSEQLVNLFAKLARMLNPKGKIIIIQPNYYYSYRSYWDDYTHVKAFSHTSLADFCIAQGYKIFRFEKRFLPFSMKSRLPKSYFLTRLYLMLPYRPGAGQMLAILEKG